MISNRMDINQVLLEMRSLKAQAQAMDPSNPMKLKDTKDIRSVGASGELPTVSTEKSNFGQLLNQAVNGVNELQANSKSLVTAYEQGAENVALTDVMIASQKASVSFQAMVQVRNKMVEAYRDVMNMPV